ncbi:unnamed protein product, partial [Meganyctiphanes norvegica]
TTTDTNERYSQHSTPDIRINIMNSRAIIALMLCGTLAAVDSTIIIGTVSAASVVAAVALGALAVLKGALIGAVIGRRGKRDLTAQQQDEAVEASLNVAQQIDSFGCVSKLLCEIEAVPEDQLSQAGLTFKNAFGNTDSINFHKLKSSKGIYDLALTFGAKLAKNNPKLCDQLFNKCTLPQEELFALLESQFTC